MQGDFKIVRCPGCHYEVSVPAHEYGRQLACPQCGRPLSSRRGREYQVPRIPEYKEEE